MYKLNPRYMGETGKQTVYIYISTPEKKPGLGSQKINRLNSGYGPGVCVCPVGPQTGFFFLGC